MSRSCVAATLVTVLGVGALSCGAADPSAASSGQSRAARRPVPERATPAVLILRTYDIPGPDGPVRQVEAIQPRINGPLPFNVRFRDDPEDAPGDPDPGPGDTSDAPVLGPGYDCIRAYLPNPRQPQLHYFVYNVDLNNPNVAQTWTDLARAQRHEARQAWAEWTSDRDWERRKQQLLSANQMAVREGIGQLRAGQYREAIITLTRAADLDQGDERSRVLLCLARVAVGHDTDAAKALRRALELQPKLVPAMLDLDGYMSSDEEYDRHVDALGQRLQRKGRVSADEYFVLGFLEFQRGRHDAAYSAFRKAAQRRPKDTLTASYLDLTKPAMP